MKALLERYLQDIVAMFHRGDAREESYYKFLDVLLNNTALHLQKTAVSVTVHPRLTPLPVRKRGTIDPRSVPMEGGQNDDERKRRGRYPDFRIWDGTTKILGYIEAKKPGTDLDKIENSRQLLCYREYLPNLVLTNFFEFRLYRDGHLIDTVSLGALQNLALPGVDINVTSTIVGQFTVLFQKFFIFSMPHDLNARRLAKELAKRTRLLRDQVIIDELEGETVPGQINHLQGFYEAFKKYLIHGLTEKEFADLYAQTVTYGLFAARSRCQQDFTRKNAVEHIPRSLGILHDMFAFISMGDSSVPLRWYIDDIAALLANTDVNNLFREVNRDQMQRDPVVHFYETFLSEYDPKLRTERGVYYTPQPVVKYIIESVDYILKTDLGMPDGLANKDVKILDPAAGTLTFMIAAARKAVENNDLANGSGTRNDFIRNHILEDFYAFELMAAPYTIGHLNMLHTLKEEMGFTYGENDRFPLYLTNALEMQAIEQANLPGMSTLSEESRLAGEVKKNTEANVILGNPPYAVSSNNKSDFIEKEMELYKSDVQDERNLQPLSDDYIKFIRFAHWKINQVQKGMVALITNNSFLSGVIHRGMRKKLLETFDRIYILNLHGNIRIGERTPTGKKDENIFEIMQGLTIIFLIKTGKKGDQGMPARTLAELFYNDVWGDREEKGRFLDLHNISVHSWFQIEPRAPYYFFIKKDFSHERDYNRFIPVMQSFMVQSSGIKTHRDHLVVGFTKEEVMQRMSLFAADLPDEVIKDSLKIKETSSFNLTKARQKVREYRQAGTLEEKIVPFYFRPFDIRYLCYIPELVERDRFDVMKNFLRENLGLCIIRQYSDIPVKSYNFAFCVDGIVNQRIFYSVLGTANVVPLYLYPYPGRKGLFNDVDGESKWAGGRSANINPGLLKAIAKAMSQEKQEKGTGEKKEEKGTGEKISVERISVSPEDIFYYVYSVLHAALYRDKYAEHLKIDFPRIPFTTDHRLFQELVCLGEKLVQVHLMKSGELDDIFTSTAQVVAPRPLFEVIGDNKIQLPVYDEVEQRVYINKQQYFSHVDRETWEYQVGGYQVMEKWLKERRGRRMCFDDIRHYIRIARALQLTRCYTRQIDALYPAIEQSKLVDFSWACR